MKKTFVGDTIALVLETGKDISAFATMEIHYKKPSGLMGHWDAAVGSTNTKLTYTTTVADFDEAGEWSVQARVANVLETVVLTGMWNNFMVYSPFIDTPAEPV